MPSELEEEERKRSVCVSANFCKRRWNYHMCMCTETMDVIEHQDTFQRERKRERVCVCIFAFLSINKDEKKEGMN